MKFNERDIITGDSLARGPYRETMTLTPRSYAAFALALSAALLIGAWTFQYGFGYAPCQMCYWQRHAHKAVVGVSVLAIIWHIANGARAEKNGTALIMLIFFISAALAFWHVGVEMGFIEELASCTAGDVDMSQIGSGDLLGSLDKKIKPPACSDVAWSLFGISMAGYNAIFSLLGAAMGAVALRAANA